MALTFDDIVTAAREKSAVPDPDSDSWREGLEILLKDNAEADALTERGWGIMKNRYVEALAGRMQLDEFARKNSSVMQVPVKRPVFILGMPRTGTTVVSYLMASDPANRSLLRWEAYQGGAPAARGALKTDPRCLAEVAKDEAMLKANPNIGAAHWEPGDGPTECVHLVAQDFRSLMLAVLTVTPTYHDWILFTDMASAFAHRKRVLQALQSTNGGRWVLKMPSDSLFIRQLFKTFPDAKVIWTHRDPYAAFASVTNMRGKSRLIFNKDSGLDYIRRFFPQQLAFHLARPLEVSQERPNDIYHLYYDDMMADPLAQMKKIYAWLGDDWTEATQAGMESWLQENPQGRYGVHKYSLAEWGFTKKELEPYFSDYLRAHPVATGQEA
jgi:hypothetical protein